MNNEQQQIIDEAYKNYLNKCLDKKCMKENVFFDGSSNHHLYLKEEFINKCKTDAEFSERWGLKIEERELSHQERIDLKNSPPYDYGKPANGKLIDERLLNSNNIPTKLITVTYQGKKIESYE